MAQIISPSFLNSHDHNTCKVQLTIRSKVLEQKLGVLSLILVPA